MIVMISPQTDFENELPILNQLFSAGLEYYHIRKPHKNRQEHAHYLKAIDSKYHPRIVVHHCHDLSNDFDLKGIHFEERQRRNYIETPTRYFKDLSLFGKTISSSFQDLNDLVTSDFEFDYHLLDPVLSSNLVNTEVSLPDVNHIDKLIIGRVGIDKYSFHEVLDLGYKGIAIFERFWECDAPAMRFTDLKTVYDSTDK